MEDLWCLLESNHQPAALNMAVDEALLTSASQHGAPVLRFYGWSEAAATFGYAQRWSEVEQWTPLRPLIRRPTGGGVVEHDADWTYSVVIPPRHAWYALSAVESYRQMHEWIQAAFRLLGASTELAPRCRTEAPGRCFVGAEKFDLVVDGRKIAGAAQRRNRLGLLIQGSVQPRGIRASRADWCQAMLDIRRRHHRATWQPHALETDTLDLAHDLARTKYALAEYNRRR